MATIQLDIQNVLLPRVLDAFAVVYQYNPATDGTKAQFAKKQLARHIRAVVQSYEVQKASEAAAQTAADAAVDLGGIT